MTLPTCFTVSNLGLESHLPTEISFFLAEFGILSVLASSSFSRESHLGTDFLLQLLSKAKVGQNQSVQFLCAEFSAAMGRVTHMRVTRRNKSWPGLGPKCIITQQFLPSSCPSHVHTTAHQKLWKTFGLLSTPRITLHGEDCILHVTLPIRNTFALIMEKLWFIFLFSKIALGNTSGLCE